MTKLKTLAEHGQSLWLDYIRRGLTRGGELARTVADGIRGVTSNPSIFESAIAGSEDYRDAVTELVGDENLDAMGLYEGLAIQDIKEACDVLRTVYDSSEHRDGFVSLEVAPGLARDTEGTIADARRLWGAVDRPNLMIKVPGTAEGIDATEQLIADGINVNVTLIFAQGAYEDIASAYIRGLQARTAKGQPIADVASVASFFVSRIDSEVDRRLERVGTDQALALRGKIAVANAKLAYRIYESLIDDDAWKSLAAKGARPQRLLWASTGTKNKAYSDVLYVDELIGRDTVNTVPPKTLDAFVDHGTVAETLTADVDAAQGHMEALASVGISMDEVTDVLLEEGLGKFEDAMSGLLSTVAAVQRKTRGSRLNRLTMRMPDDLSALLIPAAEAWDKEDKTRRLWNRDASVWTDGPEAKWLGWLDIVATQQANGATFDAVAKEAKTAGFSHVLLLGMGGSSLCPDVLAKTFGGRLEKDGWPKLRILDSTVPAQVLRTHAMVDPKTTLFVVASKSGSTLEPTVFMESFLARAKRELGDAAGQHFVAITDPGSKLEAFAREQGFRHIFHGVADIGGRFSALSNFGMIPAALMGLRVPDFLAEAAVMVDACKPGSTSLDNSGVSLGMVLGTAASAGRDKLTIVASPAIGSLGAWLEQLVAESTGKHGKAIIPVDGERLGAPAEYGNDRLFVYLRLRSTPNAGQDRAVERLAEAGHPVVSIELDDIDALPQELFRWQVATAVAGSLMRIDPFDQPDVEASKIASKAMTAQFEADGALPPERPFFEGAGVALFADEANTAAITGGDLSARLASHLDRVGPSDYVALLAYVDHNPAHQRALQQIRHRITRAKGVATCLGFGPRFLHSTGQAYKGGSNNGVFLQVTSDDAENLEVPGRKVDFGVVKAAQARGDFQVLGERGRRAVRVHLGADVTAGLAALDAAVGRALGQEKD